MGRLLTFPKREYIVSVMKVMATRTINAYRECYPEADGALKTWVAIMEGNEFKHFPELKNKFGPADFVQPDRVIFNIKGNHFRLITAVDFERQVVFVKWFGRHKDYDKINPSEVQHEYPPC
jgi:mRNA interferase HigB